MTSAFEFGSRTRETMLVVEDTDTLRELVVTVLGLANYHVLQAPNAQDALVAANHGGKIDLLLSDVRLPGMSGLDLAHALKASRPEIRVVLMSAFTGADIVGTSGFSFIQKPFTAKTPLEKLHSVLHPDGNS